MANSLQAIRRNGIEQIIAVPNVQESKLYRGKPVNLAQGLLVGLGSLAVAAGIVGILIGRNVIPLKVGNNLNLFLGGGSALVALGAASVATSFFMKSEGLRQLRIASFNVGEEKDWGTLAAKKAIALETPKDVSAVTNEEVERFKQKNSGDVTENGVTEYQSFDKRNRTSPLHAQKVAIQLGNLINESPSIILLQEYVDDKYDTHVQIKDLLLNSGYTIVGVPKVQGDRTGIGLDTAVAYKTHQFRPIFGRKVGEESNGSVFVDLKHHATGTVVRAWSGHLQGFNAAHVNTPQSTVHVGDRQFREELDTYESTRYQPHITVGGMDSNSTRLNNLYPLHPARIQMATDDPIGYITDQQSYAPTFVDVNDGLKRKYDHTFVKINRGLAAGIKDPQIRDFNIVGINPIEEANHFQHSNLLNPMNDPMSDHLPVISVINFAKRRFAVPFLG